MARSKKSVKSSVKVSNKIPKPTKAVKNTNLQSKFVWKENYAGFILGAIILVAIGILVANFFVKNSTNIVSDIKTDVSNVEQLKTVTVEKGESLSSIAKRELGDANLWPEIVKENGLTSSVVEAGQSLKLPKVSTTAAVTTSPKPEDVSKDTSTKPEPEAKVSPTVEQPASGEYLVVEGDTLWEIAIAQYGDPTMWRELAQLNKVSYNSLGHPLIYTGTVILLPAK